MTGVSPAARLNNVSWLAGNCLTINYLPEILGANGEATEKDFVFVTR